MDHVTAAANPEQNIISIQLLGQTSSNGFVFLLRRGGGQITGWRVLAMRLFKCQNSGVRIWREMALRVVVCSNILQSTKSVSCRECSDNSLSGAGRVKMLHLAATSPGRLRSPEDVHQTRTGGLQFFDSRGDGGHQPKRPAPSHMCSMYKTCTQLCVAHVSRGPSRNTVHSGKK